MRLVLIHYSAPPIVGGVENVLARHARLMTEAGHAVRVVAARGEQWDDRVPLILIPQIGSTHPDVLAVKTQLDVGRLPSGFDQLAADILTALRPLLWDADAIIAHNVCSLNKNPALTAALYRLRIEMPEPRFILWHHDLAWTTPRYRSELHDGYPWDLLRTHWPGVEHVTVSELRRRELASLINIPAESIAVVPSGVDAGRLLKFEAQTYALIERLNLAEADPLLLLPARLTPRKNIELALRVLDALRRESPAAMLLVTGPEGPHNPANARYRQRLLALRDELGLKGAAHFILEHTSEYLPDSVIADFFRLADALILPSREEGFGIPLIEAAIARLPIFCADIPSLRELGGGDVTYFSPNDEPASIAALMAEHWQINPFYRFAARAKKQYAWERVYAHHIAPLLASSNNRRLPESKR